MNYSDIVPIFLAPGDVKSCQDVDPVCCYCLQEKKTFSQSCSPLNPILPLRLRPLPLWMLPPEFLSVIIVSK